MNYLNGGYVMIDKADSNIYAKALGALNAGKPILWYENSTTCYYIDLISKSGDDIILTKGGKTITITDANVVTESGEIQNHLYSNNVYINGVDEDTNNCYIYLTILATKELTNTEIEDYIKQKVENYQLQASGYANSYSIEYAKYDTNGATYLYMNSNDEEKTFEINSINNKSVQIF